MARLNLLVGTALVVAVAAVAAGCGGDETTARTACDDAPFVAQDEELYVALVTVQNAAAQAGPPGTLADDLRRGADALAAIVDEAVPCDERLVELRDAERVSIEAMRAAADELAGGGSAAESLATIARDLARVQDGLPRTG